MELGTDFSSLDRLDLIFADIHYHLQASESSAFTPVSSAFAVKANGVSGGDRDGSPPQPLARTTSKTVTQVAATTNLNNTTITTTNGTHAVSITNNNNNSHHLHHATERQDTLLSASEDSPVLIATKEKDNAAEAASELSADASSMDDSITAVIGQLERLIRTHSIWFLPDIGRHGVIHLLQGKEPGSFIVRQSSKASTMAISVRLPDGKGPHIEHYLILTATNGKFHLEGKRNA